MHSAGIDALVLQKSITLCLQIFLPIVVIGCALREWARPPPAPLPLRPGCRRLRRLSCRARACV